ncbi:hypothetical protein FRC04_008947, partial [Tulasnella sp. 424]
LKNLPLQTGRVTHIIITSLSYPRMDSAATGISMELPGTKFDFVLLLRHFDYRHEGSSVDFTLLNDFDVDFTDSTGARKVIPTADTSQNSIRCTIQRTMRTAEPNTKIVFYFGGHGENAEVNMMGGDSGDECDFQTIVAGDGRRIYGTVCMTPREEIYTTYLITPTAGAPVLVLRRSVSLGFGQCNEDPTIEGLVEYLSKNCDPKGDQLPQISCSRKIKGRNITLSTRPPPGRSTQTGLPGRWFLTGKTKGVENTTAKRARKLAEAASTSINDVDIATNDVDLAANGGDLLIKEPSYPIKMEENWPAPTLPSLTSPAPLPTHSRASLSPPSQSVRGVDILEAVVRHSAGYQLYILPSTVQAFVDPGRPINPGAGSHFNTVPSLGRAVPALKLMPCGAAIAEEVLRVAYHTVS